MKKLLLLTTILLSSCCTIDDLTYTNAEYEVQKQNELIKKEDRTTTCSYILIDDIESITLF